MRRPLAHRNCFNPCSRSPVNKNTNYITDASLRQELDRITRKHCKEHTDDDGRHRHQGIAVPVNHMLLHKGLGTGWWHDLDEGLFFPALTYCGIQVLTGSRSCVDLCQMTILCSRHMGTCVILGLRPICRTSRHSGPREQKRKFVEF